MTARERLADLPTRELPGGLRLAEARSPRARTLGLALLDHPPRGEALLLRRCGSVHTFGMRFAIDVLFLDRHGQLARIVRGVPPRRVLWCAGAAAVVEICAGEADRFMTAGLASAVFADQLLDAQEERAERELLGHVQL